MRLAGHGLALGVVSVLRGRGHRVYGARVMLLIGSGNNGADALFAGAHLASQGARTTALLTSARTRADALAAFARAGGRVLEVAPGEAPGSAGTFGSASTASTAGTPDAQGTAAFLREAELADVIVDGLLGTGGRGGLREPAAGVVAQLCKISTRGALAGSGPAVVACDLPSGVDATSGEVYGPVLAADLTVTFGALKTGLVAAPGEQLCGAVSVVELGIAGHLGTPDVLRLEGSDLAAMLPRPESTDQKYTRGVAGIVAGSARYPGAALLSVAAASACGPGMVRYLGDPAVSAALHVRNPEAVCSAESPEDVRVQAWLAGPGVDGDSAQLGRARLAMASGLPTVVDAGALALVGRAGQPGAAEQSQLVLTPHAGELSTLLARLGTERSRTDVEAAPVEAARQAARLTGATVLLKGPTTVVASPDGPTYTQGDGTPSLATAGSGDTLGGILVALLAMRAGRPPGSGGEPRDNLPATAALAAALHGRLGQDGAGAPLNAGMLAGRIPAVWAGLTR